MERYKINSSYEKLTRGELTPEEMKDLEAAVIAREDAHTSTSDYIVGATIRTNDDLTVNGWNVENGTCSAHHAEVNALGRIPRSNRERGIKRVTIVGGLKGIINDETATICGDCRQKLLEFVRPEDEPIAIMAGTRGKVIRVGLKDLLPLAFSPTSIRMDS